MRSTTWLCAWWGVVGVAVAPLVQGEDISFNRDIRPILSDNCFACHGPDEKTREGDLRLDTYEGATEGGEFAIPIVPGKPEESELVARIRETDPDDIMPPPESHKTLDEEEKVLLERWIAEGAGYEDFWAFVPPKKTDPPKVATDGWSKRPIDRYVLRRLKEKGLAPSEEADKRTLVRRVTLDLTGLPPTPGEVRAFLADESSAAYGKLVDDLLARPAYGEQLGRYWLDLVRFADTNGMHKDFYRNLHSYRDWVIRAFNENLGYDDFIRYQLAGDLYPEPTEDQLIASGFQRLHLIIDRGTALPEESFFKNVVDRTTAVGTAFMGLTMHCAMCHDHKYDPITQKDFYSLYAFFNNINAQPETAGRPRNGLQPPYISLASAEEKEVLADMDAGLAALGKEIESANKAAAGEDGAKKKELLAAVQKKENQRKALDRKKRDYEGRLPHAMVMRERTEVRPAQVMNRGQYDDPGEEVTRATPAFLPPMKQAGEVATRMELAEWFVQPDNPLTARVMANRIWQQLLGTGLVKTSEDLGAQGEVPSHPGLLDHLAVSFVESGWDVKALVKEIVMSKTYRQASAVAPGRYATDPGNRLLARGSRFRMDAEMVRDQVLFTSGLLVDDPYHGPSVKPPQPDGLWKAVTMTGEVFRPDSGDDIYRRSVYTFWKRAMPPPQMTILNAPIRDACTARRERTNTPTQALLLLNEGEYFKAARTLADRVLKEKHAGPAERLARLYETVTVRLPDEEERAVLLKLLADLETNYRNNPARADELVGDLKVDGAEARAELAAWTVVANTIYNLDITKTRE